MTFTPVPFNQVAVASTVPAGSQIICIVGGNLRRADFSLLPKGDKGDPGDQGVAGASVNLLGTLDNEALLPTNPVPVNGDAYFIGTNLWVYIQGVWTDTGTFQGEPGEAGLPVEFQTADGFLQYRVVGDANWINLVSLTAITGPQGEQGDTGLQGPPGEAGSGGDSLIILGSSSSNTIASIDIGNELNGIGASEGRYLGNYILTSSKLDFVPVELEIDFKTGDRNNQVDFGFGYAWFDVELVLSEYEPDFQNQLVRITLKDTSSFNPGGDPTIIYTLASLPIDNTGINLSKEISLQQGQELRIDNTKLLASSFPSFQNSFNAFSSVKLRFFKPEGRVSFELASGEANLNENLLSLFDNNSGSYYGY